MLHDIFPKNFSVYYKALAPTADDTVVYFEDEKICCRTAGGETVLPVFGEISDINGTGFIYLFSIDGERFFMPDTRKGSTIIVPDAYGWQDFTIFRTAGPRHTAFAVVTAQQLYQWYRAHIYCGRCGTENGHSERERACVCPVCGLVEYPKISPVVIVAVTNGEYLLVTRYRDRPFRRYALVAGFSEIGESLEDTVHREVFEETGIRVKNLRYYKSQPWGFTSTLLSGYFCDLDGDPTITVDESELSEAIWISREDIPPADSDIALTSEMMEVFRTGIRD